MNFPLNLASGVYRTAYELRKFLYSIGIKHPRQVAQAKIICIGNLSVGGTGKTPFVAFLAQHLCQQNYKVAIVSRGYRGSANKKPTIVRNAEKILINNYKLVGDEPVSYTHL
ncbi:MAG: tetraacyldisaccharide 4'-kinase, partial [Candidatus Sumerlaeia bacterium]|nr:tetraacyldisaccharide 4'-kinase [Candidatus Sumerlaeia bacterium]